MDKNHILEEIRRTAQENDGVPLGRQRFRSETGIRESDWRGRFWINWSDAVGEAGFQPNKKQSAFDADSLLENLAGLIRELGHYPVGPELRMQARKVADFPSHDIFRRRFGPKAQTALALLSWCEANSGWEDVRAISAPLAAKTEESGESEESSTAEIGYVYLLKSGKYFKLGRTKAPGRREYELRIQLPERVVTVHTIKTDDPIGIERYWHERFSDRRKNGEWFELRKEDVSAFRRRKFM